MLQHSQLIDLSQLMSELNDVDRCLHMTQVDLKGSDYAYPILQSYIDICILGCLEYGTEAAEKFVESTAGWSDAVWLNDRMVIADDY